MTLCPPRISFISDVEPSTKVFRIVLPPGRAKMPFLKQVGRIVEMEIVAKARETMQIAEKRELEK